MEGCLRLRFGWLILGRACYRKFTVFAKSLSVLMRFPKAALYIGSCACVGYKKYNNKEMKTATENDTLF